MNEPKNGRPRPRTRTMASLLMAAIPLIAGIVVWSVSTGDVALGADRPPSTYVQIDPFRQVDTRTGIGTTRIDGNTLRVAVAGSNGVPSNATAVVVTIVAIDGQGAGFVTAFPSGEPLPQASTINYQSGLAYSSEAIVPLGRGGAFDIFTLTPVNVVVDVTGAFVPNDGASGGRFVGNDPNRILDTRAGSRFRAGQTRAIDLPGSVPADATAVVMTLTATGPNQPGFVTAWSDGPLPATSTLNIPTQNSTRASTAIVAVADGAFNVFSSSDGHLVVDLLGYFTGPSASWSREGLYVPMTPVRKVDTRATRWLERGETRSFRTDGAGIAVGSLAMIQPRTPGFASVFANGTPNPGTSSINLVDSTVIANFAVSRSSSEGVALFSSTRADYVFDQYGYFTSPQARIVTEVAPTTPAPEAPSPAEGCSISDLLVPSCGMWFGASTPNRSGGYDYVTGLAEYEAVAQNTPDILHFYKNGAQRFPTASERQMAERPGKQRSLLLYNWKPSGTWASIARGGADNEIATVAANIKAYPHKLFLNIWHEPEDNVRATAGSGMTANDYAAMFRHVVTELREAGVDNAVFVWNVMGYWGWRQHLDALYPGDQYVDWVCFDPYIKDNIQDDLGELMGRSRPDIGWPGFYNWATAKAPGKPIMMCEWGVDLNSTTDPAGMLDYDIDKMAADYPMLKAWVYWNEANVWNCRIDDQTAKGRAYGAAFRRLAAHPQFNAMTPDSAP